MSISCENPAQAVTVHICSFILYLNHTGVQPSSAHHKYAPSQEQKPSKMQILTSTPASIEMAVLARHGHHCPGNNWHGGERAVGPPAVKCSIGLVSEIAAPQIQQ